MAEWLARVVLIPGAFAVWIGQQLDRWREWRDVDGSVLVAIRQGHNHGRAIEEATRLGPGRVYPALARLEQAGRITSGWDRDWGVARRRLYAAVDEGGQR